jgi:hypothetical protein
MKNEYIKHRYMYPPNKKNEYMYPPNKKNEYKLYIDLENEYKVYIKKNECKVWQINVIIFCAGIITGACCL